MPRKHKAIGLMKDTEEAVSESQADSPGLCPTSGMTVIRKPEWCNIKLDRDYGLDIRVLGDSIIVVKPYGYSTVSGLKKALTHIDRVIHETFPQGRPFVSIEDFSELRGAAHAARTHYIEYQKSRTELRAMLFFGVSTMFNLGINLARRLNIVNFEIHIAEDYAEAVKTAVKILADDKATINDRSGNRALKSLEDYKKEDHEIFEVMADNCPEAVPKANDMRLNPKVPAEPTPTKKPIQDTNSYQKGEVCPVSGLSITSRSEWADIALADGYTVTFKFIGDRILHSFSQGNAGEHGIENLFKERQKVLHEMLGPDEPFFELRDYSAITGGVTRNSRHQLSEGMRATEDRTIGWIGYKAPTAVRLAVNVGKKLHRAGFPMLIVKDYKTAIQKAVAALEKAGYGQKRIFSLEKMSSDLQLKLDGYSTKYQIIAGNVIYGVTHGFLKEKHIGPIFEMFEKLISKIDPQANNYYLVFDISGLSGGTRRARKQYVENILNWHKQHPFNMLVLCGANRLLRAATSLARTLAPFKVRMVNDVEDALGLIEKDGQAKDDPLQPQKAQDFSRDKIIENYVDEILHFVGRINWESDGVQHEKKIDPSHPFTPVFDAIELIKLDLDTLFHEGKRAVEELRKSEEKYRTILENIEDGYFEVDIGGNFIFFNDSMCRILGYSKNEMLGMNNRKYMSTETAARVYQTFNRVYTSGVPEKDFSWEFIKKDGTRVFVESSVSLIKDRTGKYVGFRGLLRDVTDRKEIEEKIKRYSEHLEDMVARRTDDLRRSEEKYRTILENIEDGYYEVDLKGHLTFFNDSLCKITGHDRDELMGLNTRHLTDKEHAKTLFDEYHKVYLTGVPTKQIDWARNTRQGETKFLENSVTLIKDGGGQPTGFRGIVRDVTGRKHLEQELIEKRKQAEEASRAKSDFLANMSHELRTPLNHIIGFTQLVVDGHSGDLNDQQDEFLNDVLSSSKHLLSLIDDVLDLSKIEAGKMELDLAEIDLRSLIESCLMMFKETISKHGLKLSTRFEAVPDKVTVDERKLKQIIYNLVSNAVKFTPDHGSIELSVRSLKASKDGLITAAGKKIVLPASNGSSQLKGQSFIMITAKDSGVGIKTEDIANIFDPFGQARNQEAGRQQGTGLGLSLVNNFVQLHGGTLWAESEGEGQGSTVSFIIPV